MKSSRTTDNQTEGGRLRIEVERLGGVTVVAALMGVGAPLFYKYFSNSATVGVKLEGKLKEAGVNMDYVRGRVTSAPKVSPVSNVGRLYLDEPSAVDVLQPNMRQRVHAGRGSEVIETTAEFLNVTKHYRGTVTIDVVGDSLVDAGIMGGDKVVIRRGQQPHNGDIVLAVLNDEFLLKGYDTNGDGHVTLWPANLDYDPIAVNVDDSFFVEGVMIELIRKSDRSWLALSKRKYKGKG